MENHNPLLALLTFLMSMTENDSEPTIAPIMSIETENVGFTLFLN